MSQPAVSPESKRRARAVWTGGGAGRVAGIEATSVLVHKLRKAVSILSSWTGKFRRRRRRGYQNTSKHRNARSACGFHPLQYSRQALGVERMSPGLRAGA